MGRAGLFFKVKLDRLLAQHKPCRINLLPGMASRLARQHRLKGVFG